MLWNRQTARQPFLNRRLSSKRVTGAGGHLFLLSTAVPLPVSASRSSSCQQTRQSEAILSLADHFFTFSRKGNASRAPLSDCRLFFPRNRSVAPFTSRAERERERETCQERSAARFQVPICALFSLTGHMTRQSHTLAAVAAAAAGAAAAPVTDQTSNETRAIRSQDICISCPDLCCWYAFCQITWAFMAILFLSRLI